MRIVGLSFKQEASNTPEDVPSSLYFKGSIGDAIVRAQTEKKILIVFVAGTNCTSKLFTGPVDHQS